MGAGFKVFRLLFAAQVALVSVLLLGFIAPSVSADVAGAVVEGVAKTLLQGALGPAPPKPKEMTAALHGRCMLTLDPTNEVPCNAIKVYLDSTSSPDSLQTVISNGLFDFSLDTDLKYRIRIESDKYKLFEAPAEVSGPSPDVFIRLRSK